MKKISKYALSAVVAVSVLAQNALAAAVESPICRLLDQFKNVISTLRTLAFIGAAFLIMEWAWGYIASPKGLTKDDIKEKGLGLLVGFALLLGVGVVLQFVGSATGMSSLGCIVTTFK